MPLYSPLKYHPNRYRRMRSYAKRLLDVYREHVGDEGPTIGAMQAIQHHVIEAYNSAIAEVPRDERPASTSLLNHEISYFMHYAAFESAGRNIFDFNPHVTELFRQTDVDDVPLATIHLPYRAFYIWFGEQRDLDLWGGGYFVDGAYVSENFGRLEIVLSTLRRDVDYMRASFLSASDRYYYFYVPRGAQDSTVGDALTAVVETDKPFEAKIHGDMSGSFAAGERTVHITDVHRETAVATANENRAGFATFREALRLIVNGLCFISAYRDDIRRRYNDDAPPALLGKLQRSANAKEKRRTEAKLTSMGYTRIHFCGDAFEALHADVPTGVELSPHWRRGHWRHQAFGAMRVERKLIWIMPTIVRRDKGIPEHGHIYLVDPGG